MVEHTPGPWHIEPATCSVKQANFQMVAAVYGDDPSCEPDERMRANAALIAAAPDLLEALECLLPGLVLDLRYASDDDDKDAMRSRIKTVTDALAKTIVLEGQGSANG